MSVLGWGPDLTVQLKKNRFGIPPFIYFNCHVIICKSDAGCIVFTPICVLVTAALLSVVEEVRVSLGEKCKWTVISPAKLFWWPHGHRESSLGQCGWWRNNPNTTSILGVAPP